VGSSSRWPVTVSIETTRENLPEVLKLVAKVLREPAFPASELEQLKNERVTEIESQRTDTAHQVELRLDPVNDLAWGPAGIALGCVTGLVRLDLRHRPPTDRQ